MRQNSNRKRTEMVTHNFKVTFVEGVRMVMWCEDCGLAYTSILSADYSKIVWREISFEDAEGNPTKPHMRCDEMSQQAFTDVMAGAIKDAFTKMSEGGDVSSIE